MQGTQGAPKAPLGNNARPPQPLHQRTIRTNINFQNVEVKNNLPLNYRQFAAGDDSTVPKRLEK